MTRTYVLYNIELEVYINLQTNNMYHAITKMYGINKLELHHTKWQINIE